MKTIIALISFLAILVSTKNVSAQEDMLALSSQAFVEETNKNQVESLPLEVYELNGKLYFKITMINGQTAGVIVLESKAGDGEFEVVEFKDLIAVNEGAEILYCFKDEVAINMAVSYRVRVITASFEQVVDAYTHGVVLEQGDLVNVASTDKK